MTRKPEEMTYAIRPISMKGQCLFVVSGEGAPDWSPYLSLQMPTEIAEYLLALVREDQAKRRTIETQGNT